jgi:acyl carrier protein
VSLWFDHYPAAQDVESYVSICEDLTKLVESWKLRLPDAWDGDTSLVRSGILDSVAFLQLIFWIEQQTGKTVDPTQIDLVNELDSIADVVRFIESHRVS